MPAGVFHARDNDTTKNNQKTTAYISEMAVRLAKNCFLLVAKFYIMVFLVTYEWAKKIVNKILVPLEPIFVQVRKVPKKDVCLEGIFYQFLRLQFLIFLYMTPFARKVIANLTKRVKSWVVDLVGVEEKTRHVGSTQD